MDECRVLWERYQNAMGHRARARTPVEKAAWWAEANEWLRRYFDAVEGELERQTVGRA